MLISTGHLLVMDLLKLLLLLSPSVLAGPMLSTIDFNDTSITTILPRSVPPLGSKLFDRSPILGNSTALKNCTNQQAFVTLYCFSQWMDLYDVTLENNLLPSSNNSTFFHQIFLDSSETCNYFDKFKQCLDGLYSECMNYNTITRLTANSADAAFYVYQMSLTEFYCGYDLPFIDYFQCMQNIELNDVADDQYHQCTTTLGVDDNCDSIHTFMDCQGNVVANMCGRFKTTRLAFCDFRAIQLRMTGWDGCYDMPCIKSAPVNMFVLLLLFIVYLNI